jgi:hypothetical protein
MFFDNVENETKESSSNSIELDDGQILFVVMEADFQRNLRVGAAAKQCPGFCSRRNTRPIRTRIAAATKRACPMARIPESVNYPSGFISTLHHILADERRNPKTINSFESFSTLPAFPPFKWNLNISIYPGANYVIPPF